MDSAMSNKYALINRGKMALPHLQTNYVTVNPSDQHREIHDGSDGWARCHAFAHRSPMCKILLEQEGAAKLGSNDTKNFMSRKHKN